MDAPVRSPSPTPGGGGSVYPIVRLFVALILMTYVVPGLQSARPWTSEDPVVFWNIIGREILGESTSSGAGAGDERPYAEYLDFDLDRTYAEIAFAAYVAARNGALPSERAPGLFEETRTALESALG